MARKLLPGWSLYKEQMEFLCFGDALWEPGPTSEYARINIGDVGFIRRGKFYLLFSASSPLGSRKLGEDVPPTFEQLDVRTPELSESRKPMCLHTATVRQVGAELSADVSASLPIETGASLSFELTENRGAALVTRHDTYRLDAVVELAFQEYTKRYYPSWVTFARDKKYGDDIHPVLVSGFDMTKDFEMVAYSEDDASLRGNLSLDVPAVATASTTLWDMRRIRCSPHTNQGPRLRTPLPNVQMIEFPSSQSAGAEKIPKDFNQCIFIRYYTMRPRGPFSLFPKVIRAGAGPHDLGSGDNKGDTFPEIAVHSGADLTATGDEDLSGQQGLAAGGEDSESDVVVRNTPDEEYSSWDVIADYVFKNSKAVSVLMHHRNLVELHAAGGADDLPSLLAKHRPRIAVDSSGVGSIHCQNVQPPEVPVESPILQTKERPYARKLAYPTLSSTPSTAHRSGSQYQAVSITLMKSMLQQPKNPDDAILSLNAAIAALNLARDKASLKPARDAFNSAIVLLDTIKDSVINEAGFVELGLACAGICQSLDRGMNGEGAHPPGPPILRIVEQLTTSMVEIQSHILKRRKKNTFSRLLGKKADNRAIAAWRSDLDRIRSVVENATFSKIMKNIETIAGEDGWHNEAIYGDLVAIKGLGRLESSLFDYSVLRTLNDAMDKSRPSRVREAACDAMLATQDQWLGSPELHKLEQFDIFRQLHSVVTEFKSPNHQLSFLTMIERLSRDDDWHPYLRKAMDIWLPFRHEAPEYILRIMANVGQFCHSDSDTISSEASLERRVEDEWAGVPGRPVEYLTADRLEPLVEVTKQLKELSFDENDRRAVLNMVERVIPSLEKRCDYTYTGPGDDVCKMVNDLIEDLRLSPTLPRRRSTSHWP